MNQEPSPEERRHFRRFALTFFAIGAFCCLLMYLGNKYGAKLRQITTITSASTLDTSTSSIPPVKEDSVRLADTTVSVSVFQSDYSAESWYAKYKSNPIAFNDDVDKKQIDIYGTVKEIKTSWMGYSIVRLSAGDHVYGDIVCDNVVHEKDGWKAEVKTLSVGDNVHVRGYFSSSVLNSEDFNMDRCHVIND